MSFYNSVKENVRKEHEETEQPEEPGNDGEEASNMAFDELKNAAEEQNDTETAEEPMDNTEIEVLTDQQSDDTDATQHAPESGAEQTVDDTGPAADPSPAGEEDQTEERREQQPEQAAEELAETDEVARDEVVQVLQNIEQQNREMLNVLNSIRETLDR